MQSENLQKIVELRHFLHRNAELSLHEAETGRILRDFLRRNTSLEIVERDGWFYAVKQGAKAADTADTAVTADAIAFRADMDALPIEEGIAFHTNAGTTGTALHFAVWPWSWRTGRRTGRFTSFFKKRRR